MIQNNRMLKGQYKLLQQVRDIIRLMDEEGLETKKDLIEFRQEIKNFIRNVNENK